MKNVYAILGTAVFAAVILCSCNKEIEDKALYDGPTSTLTVKAVLPEEPVLKVAYEENDEINLNAGIDSKWEDGDFFYAIQKNTNADTGESDEQIIRFNLTEGAGTPVGTFQAEVPSMDANTVWTAVFGKKFTANTGESSLRLHCTYDGQDGTLDHLGNYDFMITQAFGENPEFNFTGRNAHGEERDTDRLSYFLRIKLPAGVRYIEYCTTVNWFISSFNGIVPSDDKHFACVKNDHPGNWDDVSVIDLGHDSSAGEVCYIAIPAAQYGYYNNTGEFPKGVIMTFFTADKRKSNGRVINSNLEKKGGYVGTSDLSSMTLINRPLASEAVSLGTSTVVMKKSTALNAYDNFGDFKHEMAVSPEWAPFNLGANIVNPTSAEEVYGDFFCWGETSPRTAFSSTDYTYNGSKTVGSLANFPSTQLGMLVPYAVYDGTNTGSCTLQRISGTKYDAARVRWGSEWRMPVEEEWLSFIGNTNTGYNASVCAHKENVTVTYNGVQVKGEQMGPDDGSVFFPYCGYYDANGRKEVGTYGYFWSDTRIREVPGNTGLTNNPLRARLSGTGVNYGANDPSNGLAIRPVRNFPYQKTGSNTPRVAEEGFFNAYGYVKDNVGNGIAGAAVSDGYTTVLTKADGKYEIVANPAARYVYVSVPAEYDIPLGGDGRPAFYHLVTIQQGIYSSNEAQHLGDFTLTPRAAVKDRVTAIIVTDAHVRNISGGKDVQSAHNDQKFLECMGDVTATARLLESGLPVGTPANAPTGEIIGITLGDQLSDTLNDDYTNTIITGFSGVTSSTGKQIPFFYAIGNHDHQHGDNTGDREAETHFLEHFGPTNYSFNVGNIHFIVMDNIVKTGEDTDDKIKFSQHFTDEQISWLKSDVSKVQNPQNKIAVLCVHAPLTESSYDGHSDQQQAVMSALKNNFLNAHVFSGHTHNIKNDLYRGWTCKSGRAIYEHTIQAFCGLWWDASITRDGSPAGYGVFTFDNSDLYAEYNKVIGEAADFQVRSYNGSATYNKISWIEDIMHGGARGAKSYTWASPAKGKFICRVWDAGDPDDNLDTWAVSLNYNGASKGSMTSAGSDYADACVSSFLYNDVHSPFGDYVNAGTHPQMFYSANQSYGTGSFTITATHTMKSGWSATYTSSKIVNGYKGFQYGVNYER